MKYKLTNRKDNEKYTKYFSGNAEALHWRTNYLDLSKLWKVKISK